MISKLTRTTTRVLAILFAMFATCGAWASVKPIAVWNSDFVDGAARGGFTFDKNGNEISGVDGKVTIKSTASGGITFDTDTAYQSKHFSAVIGFENVSAPGTGKQGALVTAKCTTSGRKNNQAGVYINASAAVGGTWDDTIAWSEAASGRGTVSGTYPTGDTRNYLVYYCKHLTTGGQATQSGGGTFAYVNKNTTANYYNNGLRGSGIDYKGYTIGGWRGSSDYQLTDARVVYVALFPGTDSINNATDSDLREWSLPSMTSAANPASGDTLSASDNETLAAQGINLPKDGHITINGAVTVAAVFAQGDSEIRFADANSSLTVSGPVYVAGDNKLTLVPTTLSANGSKTILSASVIGSASNISVTDPTETDAIYWHEIGDTSVSIGRGTLALDYTATPGGGFASGLGSTWMSSFNHGTPAALRVGPNGTTLQYTYEVLDGTYDPYAGLSGRNLPISFSIYADLSAASASKYAIMAFGQSSNGFILYKEDSYVKAARFSSGNINGSAAQIAKPSAGYHLYTATCAADGTIKLYLDNGTTSASGAMTTKTAFTTGFQVGSVYAGRPSGMSAGDGMAVAKILGWEGVLSSDDVATLAATYPATTGEIERDITLNSSGTTLKVYSSSEASEVSALLGVDAGTITIPASQEVSVTKVRTDPSNANGAAANITVAGKLNVSGSDASIGSSAGDASITFAYWLDGNKTGDRTSTITVSSGGEINAPNAYVMMPWATPCQGATFEVSGTAKVKGIYRNSTGGTGTLTLANGGTLEVSEILSTGGNFTRNYGYGTFRVKADAEETRAINFSATGGNATTLDPDGHTLTMAAAAMTGTGAVTVGGSSGGKVLFSGFTSSYTGTIQFSDANKHMIEVTSWDNFAGSLAGTLTIDDTNKDMLGSIPWNKFTGTLKYEVTSGTLNLSAYDMSACTITVTGTDATIVLRTGQEGKLTVGENSTVELLVTEDEYKYDGYVFSGTVNGTLKYKYTADAGVSYSEVANDAYNGTNLIPYYQLFNVSNGTSGGDINTASNWGGGVVPTGRNAAFHVDSDSVDGITINVDQGIAFGDIQVYGSGIVTFSGAETLSCANLYIDSGVTVKIGNSAISVANGVITGGTSVEILSGANVLLDGVQSDSAFTVNGTLRTKGVTTIKNESNFVFNYGSALYVVDGITTLKMPNSVTYDTQGIFGAVTVGSVTQSAQLSFESDFPFNFSSAVTEQRPTVLNLYGTLSYPSKWLKFNGNNKVNLYGNSSISGYIVIWGEANTLNVYGDSQITASQRCETCALTIDVAESATLTCTAWDTANYHNGDEIVKKGSGTLKFKNMAIPLPISDSEGTLYLDATTASGRTDHAVNGTSFSGILKIGGTTNQAIYFNGDPEAQLTGWPTLRLECGTEVNQGQLWVGGSAVNKEFRVKNLSGWAKVVPWSNKEGNHYFVTQQEEDTTFSGNFVDWSGSAIGTGDFKTALTVKGGSSVKSLSLTSANDTTGPLEIQNNGKVIFSGSGSWLNGGTTVTANGVIESQRNAQVAGTVTLEEDATVSIVKVGGALVPFTATTVNLPSTGTVYVDFSAAGLTSSSGATPIMTCAVNNKDYLENLSVVGYDGEGAFSYDDVNNQIVFTPVAMDEWSYGSATWSSSSVTDSDTHNITYHDDISDVVFGAIASTPATITLDGKRTPASVTFNGGADTTYVISGGSFEPVGTVTISSGTVKIDTDATLSEVTGAGTLEIAAGRTVTLTTNTALDDIASLTGTGTLVLPAGTAPSTRGLTALLDNVNWCGTVVLSGYEASADMPLASFGNSGSKVKFMGVKGQAIAQTMDAELVLENGDYEYAFWIVQGSANNQNNLSKISGSGTIKSSGNFQQVYAIRNSDSFTGSIDQEGTSGGRIYFSTGRNGSFIAGYGMIAVDDSANGATYATIGDGNYWKGGDCTSSGGTAAGVQIKGTVTMLGAATMSAGGSSGVMLHNGATLKFNDIGTALAPKGLTIGGTSPFTFSSGTVKIAFGDGAILRDGAQLINWEAASLATAPEGTFVFDGIPSTYKEVDGSYYVLTKDTSGLFVREAVAAAIKGGVSYHATVADAIAAVGEDGSVIIIKSTTENIVYDKTKVTLSRLTTDITTGTIDPGPEYNAEPGTVADSGSYPYTFTNKATTYYWTDADETDHNWSTVGNWQYGDAQLATRVPTSVDTVVFNNGATVTRSADMEISNLTVNGAVTFTATGRYELKFSGAVDGTGTLTLDYDCLKNISGAAQTIPLSINFVHGARVAGPNAMTITGNVSISDTFEVWGTTHIVSGNVTVADGATIQTAASGNNGALTVTGTTTLNGAFTKTSQNALTLGNVIVAANVPLTIAEGGGTIVLNGAVTVQPGVTLTIPASGLTVGNSASFVLSGRSSVLVDNGSGASGKVGTSLTDGAKVISSTTAGVTTYKVGYGTIFSVY